MEFTDKFNTIESDRLILSIIEKNEGDEAIIPFYYYNIYKKETNEQIGKISIRIGHNRHSYFNGNIGYEIDANERGHHFAREACMAIMDVAKYHNMAYLIIACDYDNIPSIKTIESLGALFLESRIPPADYFAFFEGIKPQNIYRIDL